MATKAVGGGTSAVAASSHAACERFRGTDPLVTGRTRRNLAEDIGFADEHGGIPDSRWMRAQTFERLIRNERFASEVTTTAVGRLALERPSAVSVANAKVSLDQTAKLLDVAHKRAVKSGVATLIHELAFPFAGFEGDSATAVKPDFAIVAPKEDPAKGSWLIVGDAKDYERVRSKIDDGRMLKGFLQVALGAESAARWSKLPNGMDVHSSGVLAVPRNAFLQPEAVVEDLHDHREEVRLRVEERVRETQNRDIAHFNLLTEYVTHLNATFDPDTCTTCTLFTFCRQKLRDSADPTDLLIEIGVSPVERKTLLELLSNTGEANAAMPRTRARVLATLSGRSQTTGQLRTDPVGEPGTINVCIAKSDSAALGVYGVAVRRVSSAGAGEWSATVFDDPQSETTRRALMKLLGVELAAAMKDQRVAGGGEPKPVHAVVPDSTTADVLTSIADTLAGVELSRLGWKHDKKMGRPALTFNGEPATVPVRLTEDERRGVSFLLEEDRARALTLRSPIVDVRAVLSRQMVVGGSSASALRLDYLVKWINTGGEPVRHRDVTDATEAEAHTPGARLTNRTSNAIHHALVGDKPGEPRPANRDEYERLVREELAYKTATMDTAIKCLTLVPVSRLRGIHQTIEADAQAVWRRRQAMHASDLVRFGRTGPRWRNDLVESIDSDTKCSRQLSALGNPQLAVEWAADAGTRDVMVGQVTCVKPLEIEVNSRRLAAGDRLVLLHVNGEPCVEAVSTAYDTQQGGFKFSGMSIGPVTNKKVDERRFLWLPELTPEVSVGDELVLADFSMYGTLKRNKALPVTRPKPDANRAPKQDCESNSYETDPTGHQYCCRSHEDAEAESSDRLAERRARGELNPKTWPPIVDADSFEVVARDSPVGDVDAGPATPAPKDVTMDDLD